MPKLPELLKKNKLSIIVELPENNLELAEAAVRGGADALQIAENLTREKARTKELINKIKIPVGISLEKSSLNITKAVSAIGFDFINLKLEQFSGEVVKLKGISKVLSLDSKYFLGDLIEIDGMGLSALDAAILPQSSWGKDLVVGDLQNYISIVLSTGIPVIVPTQRSIKPSEVAIIADTGAKGILLTPVVMGTSLNHIEKNTREFRVAIDDLGN